jgi:hypothetical protein
MNPGIAATWSRKSRRSCGDRSPALTLSLDVGASVASLAAHGPFDLVYCDAGPGKIEHQDVTIAMTRPGGLILLDDLTPSRTDLDWWLKCSAVVAATIWVTPELGAILAVRR